LGLTGRHPEPFWRYGNGNVVVERQLALAVCPKPKMGKLVLRNPVGKVQVHKVQVGQNDAHFTMLGFTSVSDKSLTQKKLEKKGKLFSIGPVCKFNDKT
jgi:hypothetical protein